MRRAWLVPTVLLAVLSLPPIVSRAQGDPPPGTAADLWQRAVEICRANRDCYPGQAAITSEILNSRRKDLSFTEISVTLSPAGRDRLQVHLDRYLRNGVDTTEEMRPKMRIIDPLRTVPAWEDDGNFISIPDSPLDPDAQEDVTLTPNEDTRIIDGRGCRRYDFTFRREIVEKEGPRELTWRGRAWLELGSGRPVELQFSVDPLPDRIRSMGVIFRYGAQSPGRWVVTQVVFSGYGGYFFFKRYFTITTTFGRFGREPSPASGR